MAQQISSNALIQKFSELPLELREAIARPETADAVNEIALRFRLTGPQLTALASQTGLVMGGVISIPEYTALLRGELRLTDERLDVLAEEVARIVLIPIDSSMTDIHGPRWRDALKNAFRIQTLPTGMRPAQPGNVAASLPPRSIQPAPSVQPTTPTPRKAVLLPPPPPQPQPVVHQAPPSPVAQPSPPSITFLEPHPVAPPFPTKPLTMPPPPIAPGSAPLPPEPHFHPVTIPGAQLPPTQPPRPAEPNVQAANTADIIQAHYGELPAAVRDAIKNIPIGQILYEIGNEQQLNVEQMGKMANGVMRFIAGKASQEEFLDILLEDIFGGFRQKSATVSQEINAKIFTPIRKALKVTTAEPTPQPPLASKTAPAPATSPAEMQKPRPTAPPSPAAVPSKPPPAPTPPTPQAQRSPSEPEPWIIYPLRSPHPSAASQDKGPIGIVSPVPVERPDRPGWGDAYPPLDREVIPPIRPEGMTAASKDKKERTVEPPANLPTTPTTVTKTNEAAKPATPPLAVTPTPITATPMSAPESAPPTPRAAKIDLPPSANNPSRDPYREAPDE